MCILYPRKMQRAGYRVCGDTVEGKFKFLDEHLSLAVGLWAISRAEADLGSKNGAEGLPDL